MSEDSNRRLITATALGTVVGVASLLYLQADAANRAAEQKKK